VSFFIIVFFVKPLLDNNKAGIKMFDSVSVPGIPYSADLFYFPKHNAIMAMIVNYGTDGDSPLRPVFKEMRDKIARLIVEPY